MNIFKIILALFGLGKARLAQIQRAYDYIIRFLLFIILPALLFSYLLNIGVSRWGWWLWLGSIPYAIGLILSAIFIVIAFLPEVLLAVGIANMAQARFAPPTDPKRKIWESYKNLLWLTVAWINIPFMYIGGVPAGANPFAVFAIISTVTIISIVGTKPMWRRIVMISASIILAINLYSLAAPTIKDVSAKVQTKVDSIPSRASSTNVAPAPASMPTPMAYVPPAQQVVAAAPAPTSLSGNWKLKYDKDLNNTWWSSRVLITKADDRIIIAKQDTGQIFFEGQDLGSNGFKGIWHEGPTNASAIMYLPSPNNNFASGRIEMDNGTTMPIQIEI